MRLYHGSGVVVCSPEVRVTKYTKDFSWGFYCTKLPEQAERWALRHTGKGEAPTVNVYDWTGSDGLSYKVFPEMTEEWLDLIASCRAGCSHDYDIIEGPMADDEVWDYVEDFLAGNISREAFWVLARFKRPTHQISFHTEAALNTLKWKEATTLEL